MRPSITRVTTPASSSILRWREMVGFETPRSLGHLADRRGAAAEPLDDVAAERMREGLERIVSHCANYIVSEDVNRDHRRDRDAGAPESEPRRSGRRSATSCSREEKELTRRSDELARRSGGSCPGCRSRRSTASRPTSGTKSLAELFDGRSQLLIYHFMFGPVYEAGCTVCSSIADNLDPNVPHLKARDTTLMLVSRAPLEKLQAYRKRMGWDIDWVSTAGSDFNRDLGFVNTEEELKPFLEGEIPPVVEQMRGTVRHGRRRDTWPRARA